MHLCMHQGVLDPAQGKVPLTYQQTYQHELTPLCACRNTARNGSTMLAQAGRLRWSSLRDRER